MTQRSLILCFSLVVILIAPIGCGKGPAATVTGTVTLDGQSLPTGPQIDGTVMFYPQGRGAAVYGSVQGDVYVMRTGGKEGLEPGAYDVTVRIVEIGPPSAEGNPPSQKVLSPPRYERRKESGLQVDVQPGANTYDIDLKSR